MAKQMKKSAKVESKGGLVVGRREGESIIINDNIRIQFLKYDEGLIRVRIEAPKDVSILREEIYDEQYRGNHSEAKDS